MYSFDSKTEDGSIKINSDFYNIFKCSQDWLVLFCAPKTKSMIINCKGNTNTRLLMNNTEIEIVKHHKHLGKIFF